MIKLSKKKSTTTIQMREYAFKLKSILCIKLCHPFAWSLEGVARGIKRGQRVLPEAFKDRLHMEIIRCPYCN
jgi:hypothetical protein